MLVKIHSTYRDVIAICDSDLIGKTFEEGNRSLFVNPNFYQGEEKTKEEILEVIDMGLAEDFTFNIVGKESIELALQANAIKPEGVVTIQGIPVALVLI